MTGFHHPTEIVGTLRRCHLGTTGSHLQSVSAFWKRAGKRLFDAGPFHRLRLQIVEPHSQRFLAGDLTRSSITLPRG